MMITETKSIDLFKKFSSSHKYFSLQQAKDFMNKSGHSYSDETIKKSLSRLKKEKIIHSSGRGFYSTLSNRFLVDNADQKELIKAIEKKFPLIEFSLWSTKMLAPLFHHLQNVFYTFIYSERDALLYLRDFLLDKNQHVFLSPSKNELEKNVVLKESSIILRAAVSRSKSKNRISVFEKILVDFLFESEKLRIENPPADPTIIEKTIYAFELISQLVKHKLDFIFKGGTSLILIFDKPKRLSIDVDITTEAESSKIEKTLDEITKYSLYTGWVEYPRKISKIPKKHYKMNFNSIINPGHNSYILLDVLFQKNPYPSIISKNISNRFIEMEESLECNISSV